MRQSSDFQVRHHVERQRLQYALADHARQLGFRDVEVIDEDQGTSGDGVLRTGFDRLVSAVCRGEVGLVLSLEASRLARNGREWHTLLDFCAIVGCLVGDRRCLYDPAAADDRLFLGMKGNFAEAELALFRQRSQESLLALAQRGELFLHLPAGYEKVGKRRIEMTPDQRQRDALGVVFRKFTELRSVRQVWLWSRREQFEIPVRPPGQGIVWKVPTETGLYSLLHNPIYAGAYAYGRRRQETSIENGRKRVRSGILKSGPEEWTVLLRDRHEAYITWEQYERHQALCAAAHKEEHLRKSIFWSAGRQTDAGSERRRPLAAPVTKKWVGLNRRPMPCLWGLLGRPGLLGAPAAADGAREGRTGTPRGGQGALAEGPGTPRPPGRRRERGRERMRGRSCPGRSANGIKWRW